MQLTVRDVSQLLNVPERRVYGWIKEGAIPAQRVNEQYRFHRAELLEWATQRGVEVSGDLFLTAEEGPMPSLTDALLAGGIVHRLQGADKAAVLRATVEAMQVPEADREPLLGVLLAREAMGSTAIGDGIAIPHVRNPIVLHVARPTVMLSFLEQPVDFGAPDGRPVYCLFTMVSPAVRIHLHLLSRLAFALHDDAFQGVLRRRGQRDEILAELRRIEATLLQPSAATVD
jgi:nitrogen PTS system EIIA component